MATYTELYGIRGATTASALRQKIDVAIVIKANALAKLATPSEAQKVFAKAAFANPAAYQEIALNYILADYKGASITDITNATDTQVQTAVNAAVDTLLGI